MRLEAVRKEAEQKGFGLIAQNARAVLASDNLRRGLIRELN